jgi:thiol-disulfide isomerase/thioredoxin
MKPAVFSMLFTLMATVNGCASRDWRGERSMRIAGISSPNAALTGFAVPDRSLSVREITADGLRRIIRRRHGKPLLLNFWATWCIPCMEEMPDLVELSHQAGGFDIIAVSLDYPDETDSKIIPFLRKAGVQFPSYVARFQKQEDFINAIDSTWNGALPATFVYDVHGARHSSMIGRGTYKEFRKRLADAQE